MTVVWDTPAIPHKKAKISAQGDKVRSIQNSITYIRRLATVMIPFRVGGASVLSVLQVLTCDQASFFWRREGTFPPPKRKDA